jgi:hypothetical protein
MKDKIGKLSGIVKAMYIIAAVFAVMFLYMVILMIVSIFGDILANYVMQLIDLFT